MSLTADPEALARLLLDLVAIPSVNPGIDAAGEGEGAIGEFVADYARRQGFAVSTQEVWPGRRNVLIDLALPGRPTLALVTHLDTVPRHGLTARAAAGSSEGGLVYGRGACDAKGSLAAMLHALELLRDAGEDLRVNVQVAAMVDEEHTFQGVLAYLRQLAPALPSAAIVGEPTRLETVIAHKGVLRFHLRTVGRAAHTSQPANGINAIDRMVDVLAALRVAFDAETPVPHPLLGLPALSVSEIAAGVAPNVVPASCVATIDRRLLPGETGLAVLGWFDRFLDGRRRDDPQLEIQREEPFVLDDALETAPTEPIVAAVLGARAVVVGPGSAIGVPFGTDGSKLAVRGGIPTVVLGPGDIAQAHTADEYVEILQLAQAAEIYARTALAL